MPIAGERRQHAAHDRARDRDDESPENRDSHHVDVPRPTEVNASRSPRRIKMSNTVALTQMSDSFQIAAGKVSVGEK